LGRWYFGVADRRCMGCRWQGPIYLGHHGSQPPNVRHG
jgi:hypothetical protein